MSEEKEKNLMLFLYNELKDVYRVNDPTLQRIDRDLNKDNLISFIERARDYVQTNFIAK